MKTDPAYTRLREASWRRPLTAAEQAELHACLAAHPEAQADWDAEAGLNELLGRLPDAPVASNFTTRVLQAIEHDPAQSARSSVRDWRWRVWVPRLAAGVVALLVFTVLVPQRRQEAP